MGILSRFRDIIESNIHALLDKAEDPGKTIDAYMRQLNSDLGQVKAETASVLADESRALRALEECKAEVRKLQRYAEKSAEAGNDEDAIKFLQKKSVQAEKEQQLQAAYEAAAANAAKMKQMQEKLMSDLGRLEERHAQLKGKLAEARVQQRINDSGSLMGSGYGDGVFGEAEEKINRIYNETMAVAELRAGAKDDLDDLFAKLKLEQERETSGKTSPEDELAAIKNKLNNKQ